MACLAAQDLARSGVSELHGRIVAGSCQDLAVGRESQSTDWTQALSRRGVRFCQETIGFFFGRLGSRRFDLCLFQAFVGDTERLFGSLAGTSEGHKGARGGF